MKEAFKLSMRFMFPNGLNWQADKYQWRDLIRVFSMGWCDALMHVDNKPAVKQWVDKYKGLADLNWWPDDSWRW